MDLVYRAGWLYIRTELASIVLSTPDPTCTALKKPLKNLTTYKIKMSIYSDISMKIITGNSAY